MMPAHFLITVLLYSWSNCGDFVATDLSVGIVSNQLMIVDRKEVPLRLSLYPQGTIFRAHRVEFNIRIAYNIPARQSNILFGVSFPVIWSLETTDKHIECGPRNGLRARDLDRYSWRERGQSPISVIHGSRAEVLGKPSQLLTITEATLRPPQDGRALGGMKKCTDRTSSDVASKDMPAMTAPSQTRIPGLKRLRRDLFQGQKGHRNAWVVGVMQNR
ncbi:hypothetical protein RRG08_057849 [Elysia crispata]|uniref:Uncharacterized protein n=1 Tax=Elysia crispata TaxID=231223 RepID=A0AAE1B0I4_9GAST|nr:hypothetical protein RRG08_057849 [Elysia crispata]